MTDPRRPDPAAWAELVARYQTPDPGRSLLQVCNSFIPFFLLWFLMYRSLDVGYWLTLVLALPTAGFLIRIFIIQHDCGHGSFSRSKRTNDRLGFVCGVLTLTPYGHWRLSHAIHHAGSGSLARRGIGDIYTLTVNEYRQRSRWKRWAYRLYRHPLIMFGVMPSVSFMILQRLWFDRTLRSEWSSIHWTNLAIGGAATVLILTIGLKAFLLVHVPMMAIASSAGVWLFYVQHQFRNAYWVQDGEWDYPLAALKGSSYYALPAVLRWFTGNIGYHHIHHLSPMIPNYRLRECHEANPPLQQVEVLTLTSSLRTASLSLWDEESQHLVGFGHLRAAAGPTAIDVAAGAADRVENGAQTQ